MISRVNTWLHASYQILVSKNLSNTGTAKLKPRKEKSFQRPDDIERSHHFQESEQAPESKESKNRSPSM